MYLLKKCIKDIMILLQEYIILTLKLSLLDYVLWKKNQWWKNKYFSKWPKFWYVFIYIHACYIYYYSTIVTWNYVLITVDV